MESKGNILVTGGAGYIGSHTCLELLNAGFEVVVIDNLSNSSQISLDRVERLTGKKLCFIEGDILDRSILNTIFDQHSIDVVVHFAGLKAVGESCEQPLKYFKNNVSGTLVLCEAMEAYRVKRLVFSSSATVYGDPHTVPITENFPLSATNPYGRSKLMIEEICRDFIKADQIKKPEEPWAITLLRYFNPVGAHESGEIGEDPSGIPNNLMPYVSQVAVGKLKELSVFGGDYETKDGTGVRDYIHVVDLAKGHLKAIEKLLSAPKKRGVFTYNLGTGNGYSVLEIIKAFEKASGNPVRYKIVGRREGDIARCYAQAALAKQELDWKAEKDIEEMCADAWRWQSLYPEGYI
jgi:UDP-glucose 4-epimerase